MIHNYVVSLTEIIYYINIINKNEKVELIDNTEFLENKKLQQKISSYNDSVKLKSYDTNL